MHGLGDLTNAKSDARSISEQQRRRSDQVVNPSCQIQRRMLVTIVSLATCRLYKEKINYDRQQADGAFHRRENSTSLDDCCNRN